MYVGGTPDLTYICMTPQQRNVARCPYVKSPKENRDAQPVNG